MNEVQSVFLFYYMEGEGCLVFALPPFPVAIGATNLHQKQRGKEGSATPPLRGRLGAWEVICHWALCVCSAVSREDPDKDEELWCWQRLQESGLQRGHSSHRARPPPQSRGPWRFLRVSRTPPLPARPNLTVDPHLHPHQSHLLSSQPSSLFQSTFSHLGGLCPRASSALPEPGLATVLMGRKGTSRDSSGSGVPGPGDRLDFIAPDPPVGGSHEGSRQVAERQNVDARRDMGGEQLPAGSAGPGVGT